MSDLTGPVLVWLAAINIIAFCLYGADKLLAVKHLWRVSEGALIFAAVLGGSPAALLAMLIFRHKTKHPKFYIGVPVILAVQIAAAAAYILWPR